MSARVPGLDEFHREPSYASSVRTYNNRRDGANRIAWYDFHLDQAERHRRTLEELIAYHEAEAERLTLEAEAEHIALTSRARAPARKDAAVAPTPQPPRKEPMSM